MLHLLLLPLLSILAIASPLESRAPKYNVTAMNAALSRGSGILGSYSKCSGSLCSWMSKIPDDTRLTDMSIPGTHDTASWNYTPLKQIEYLKYTNIIYPSPLYRCGKQSIFQQLQAGNRAFDLRLGVAPNGKDTVFFHSEALLDVNARFEDVLYGFWRFLDENPTETLLISVKDENSTFGSYTTLQQRMYDTLTSAQAQIYVNPAQSITSTTLSAVRGKMVILRRFNSPSAIGVDLTNGFADNNPDFSLTTSGGDKVYIEDLYEPSASIGLTPHVKVKVDATTTHIAAAASKSKGDGLYITYASSEVAAQLLVPQVMADGLVVPGVNVGLKTWLTSGKGKGLKKKGIIFTDFASDTSGLVEAIIA
ncbi:uncharacterized protein I303_106873 [Kwoniella dejecticola CBS 10117]|uniref:Phosphatidylinositol-specific phospholipase C X domain-containing protein n=1 Tax=Kwoniella dejecticola CBS 10117 TaxID=1296121 RepID=A0A1A5ZTK3_9TREE|nr:uncharacterized protein I303_08487 [Kwoniella dejecticola CBS 10117]OBR81105.1 hypothetical protein I303_08487 [Kwoniella dejecticola CBS 10117]